MKNWSWKSVAKAVYYATVLVTLISISHSLSDISRELRNVEDNTQRTFKILGSETIKTEVQNEVEVRVRR